MKKISSDFTRLVDNGSKNVTEKEMLGGLHVMDDCIVPPSSNFQYSEEDWNSNKFIPSAEQKDNFKTHEQYNGQRHCGNENNDNKEFMRGKSSPSATSPTSIFATSLHRKDLSYDDLSKNIDANLAEIDMETFRSEDINSILALPAIYSGDFQSASHGEQCASVSGSLLNALELDSSIGPRNSEDDISISKDEPLFSPLREPPVPDSTISVDSLDNSSVYDNDLVLTCKANKNNYTIVFEGSGTQFSDESDYQDVCGNIEGDHSSSGAAQAHNHSNCCGGKSNSMIQSDLVFTTWSKLRRTLRNAKKKNDTITDASGKSQSLPNLNHHSVFISDKQLAHWLSKRGNKCLPVYEIQSDRPNAVHVALGKECSTSVSLLKLFMKHKAPISNSLGSSTHSDSTSSALVHPSTYPGSSENSLSISNNRTEEDSEEESSLVQNSSAKKIVPPSNDIKKIPVVVDNIKILDWNSVPNIKEANNNTINSFHSTDNNNLPLLNNWNQDTQIITNSECDNSQYFEDSLVEVPVPPLKIFHTMPIKEEEETDVSSGDEIMRDHQSHSESDKKVVNEVVTVQNNEVNCISRSPRQDWSNNLDRINNIFPTSKSNVHQANENCSEEEKLASKKVGFTPTNQSMSTQTKQCNENESGDLEDQAVTTKSTSNQTDSDTLNNACYSLSRDSSPTSSGYVSSRHSSVERLRRSSQSIANTNGSTTSMKRSNVVLATTRSCSTQIPVHVKDAVMQTSAFSSNGNAEFTLKDSSDSSSEQENIIYASSKSKSQDSSESSEKAERKDKKAIYVCYPNYSLPDLSFLKSTLGDDSVFLTPTKYVLPQEVINKEKLSRPKSYAGFETLSEKYLAHIKDWESLNVLLPDDMKQLFSKLQTENLKNADCEKHKASPTPPSSVSSSGDVSTSNSSDTNCKKHAPRSILRKSSSVGHCEEKNYHVYPPSRCPSDTSVGCKMNFASDKLQNRLDSEVRECKTLHNTSNENFQYSDKPAPMKSNRQDPSTVQGMLNNVARTITSQSCPKNDVINKTTYSSAEVKGPHGCDSCPFKSDDIIHQNIRAESAATTTDNFKSPICQCCNDHTQRINRRLFTINSDVPPAQSDTVGDYKYNNAFMYSNFKQGDIPMQQVVNKDPNKDIQYDVFNGKKAVKFSERNPLMKINCGGGYPQGIHDVKAHYDGTQIPLQSEEYCSNRRLQAYDVFDLDSDSPPQEFTVSPTQSSPNLSPASDFYFPRNTTNGGSKLFQEALKKKTGLVENLQKATEMITEHCRANYVKKNLSQISSNAASSTGQKILASLCPAVHTILSDGLLPTVQGFFGPVPNSPWKVAEASIQQGEIRKDVQDLLNLVNSEKLLTDSTYRFNAFIIGLLNLGCLDWWIGHLCTCQSLICHHYHPTALLSLLALPAAAHLRQELKEIVSPLSSLPFSLDLAFETKAVTGECWSVNGHVRRGPDECVKHEVRMCGRGAAAARNKDDKKVDLSFPFSPYRVEENEFNFKAMNNPMDLLPPTKCLANPNTPKSSSVDEYQEQQVWPGVTINPFPNARIMDDISDNRNACYQPRGSNNDSKGANVISRSKSSRSVASASHGIPRDELNKGQDNRQLAVPELSLCSSTDSGCSSQADHQALPSKKAADVANANREGKGKEVPQFKKLREQWEKITVVDEKPPSLRNPTPKLPASKTLVQNQIKTRKKTSESPKTLTPPPSSTATRGGAVAIHSRRVVSQSPIGRKTLTHHPVVTRDGRLQAPDVVPSSQVPAQPSDPVKKPKSQIPLPKAGKNVLPKSMIPVQKAGARTRSAH